MLERYLSKIEHNKRPVIAISFDYKNWICHRFAQHIARLHQDKYDFLLFSVHHLRKDNAHFFELFKHVDLILNLLSTALLYIKPLTEKPIINTIHHWTNKENIRGCVENSEHIITHSSPWVKRLVSDFNYPKEKVTMFHCGIEKYLLNPHRPLYPKNNNQITLGFFAKNTSNENDRKGTRHFKAFVQYIKDLKQLDRFHFILSGAGWDEFVQEMRQEGAHITYTAFVPDEKMGPLYSSLDFYLMLSDVEGGPATVIESMACKTPVVSTNIGLVQDIGKDDENIILVQNDNVKQIYDKIIYYTEHPAEKAILIEKAYKMVSHMTYDDLFVAYGPVFEKMLKGFEPGPITALNLKKEQKYLLKKALTVQEADKQNKSMQNMKSDTRKVK